MSEQNTHFYEFGPFRLELQKRLLFRGQEVIKLAPKSFDTLLTLVERHGQVLEKEELMKRLWPDSYVEEGNLALNISNLRKALGENPQQHEYIVTVPGRGYQFVARVKELAAESEEIAEAERVAAPFSGAEDKQKIVRGLTSSSVTRRFRWPVLLVCALGIALAATVYLRFLYRRAAPFEKVKLTRLTSSGKVILPAISPDGRYLVYVLTDAGAQSLWLRQVAVANDTQIIPPDAHSRYFGVTFSRDGNDLYYAVKRNDAGTLNRIPVLGGTPVKLLEKIDSPVGFSPDGKRLAFVRGSYPNPGESGIFIANADGSEEREVVARKPPDSFSPIFSTGPSWSPDNQLIAGAMQSSGTGYRVLAVRVADGKEQILTPQNWEFIGRVEWLPDMRGLVMIARDPDSSVAQVWFLSYPDGTARRITNDLNVYRSLSLTANGSMFATIQAVSFFNLWLAPDGDATRAKQLPTGNVGAFGGNDDTTVSWTPDGRLVYVTKSSATGTSEIWITDPTSGNRKQLTQGGFNNRAVVSPDGRYIVFISNRKGKLNVWRIDIDGNNPKQLSSGMDDSNPTVSPDNQWVIYVSLSNGKLALWKVPLAGGTPVVLMPGPAGSVAISPDGKLIAYLYAEGRPAPEIDQPPNKMAVIPFSGGAPIKVFDVPMPNTISITLRWTADGRALLYTANSNNVTNIWSQPLDGAPAHQVTDFKDKLMAAFDWSRNGKQLACVRGAPQRDAVLVTDAR